MVPGTEGVTVSTPIHSMEPGVGICRQQWGIRWPCLDRGTEMQTGSSGIGQQREQKAFFGG